MVTTMFYHFWPLKVGTLHERILSLKNTKMQGPFFLATPVNVINISSDMLFQKVQQIYTRLVNMNLLLTKCETLFNINIVSSFHPPFEPINNLFTVTGLWPGETVNALKLFLSRA